VKSCNLCVETLQVTRILLIVNPGDPSRQPGKACPSADHWPDVELNPGISLPPAGPIALVSGTLSQPQIFQPYKRKELLDNAIILLRIKSETWCCAQQAAWVRWTHRLPERHATRHSHPAS
jgi:hypothetical protein